MQKKKKNEKKNAAYLHRPCNRDGFYSCGSHFGTNKGRVAKKNEKIEKVSHSSVGCKTN